MTEINTLENSGCIPKVVNSWRTLISSINIGHQIHPRNPVEPKDCEFLVIDSKIRLRVLHITPDYVHTSLIPQVNSTENVSKRSSLSEEYWFTRNRPLRTGNCCNCSFRRSMRYSVISNQPTVQNVEKRESLLGTELPPTKITNVETFVERLVQETFFEAFQQYYMTYKSRGKINLAFEHNEPEVVLRRKNNLNTINENVKTKPNSSDILMNKSQISNPDKFNCIHKRKTQNKPIIFFVHGIGSSADMWGILIRNFTKKGYEIIAPDMLGHGYSSAPDKPCYYTFNNLLLQIISVFDYYVGTDEKRKCVLVGHSYGCSLITALYPHRASQISQLILISGGGPTPLAPPVEDDRISPFGCAYHIFYPLLWCGMKRTFFYLPRGKNFKPCNDNNGVPIHILEYISNGQKWLEGDTAFHRRIMVPTLLVHGLHDSKVTLVQECEMERTIPRAFLELIPNAGHMPMVETPEHLTHMIMCFLDMWS